jgi:hypothetical protein
MIRFILGVKRAKGNVVKALVSIGALYIDETGIHANKPGIYKIEIPTQTANPSGDE